MACFFLFYRRFLQKQFNYVDWVETAGTVICILGKRSLPEGGSHSSQTMTTRPIWPEFSCWKGKGQSILCNSSATMASLSVWIAAPAWHQLSLPRTVVGMVQRQRQRQSMLHNTSSAISSLSVWIAASARHQHSRIISLPRTSRLVLGKTRHKYCCTVSLWLHHVHMTSTSDSPTSMHSCCNCIRLTEYSNTCTLTQALQT